MSGVSAGAPGPAAPDVSGAPVVARRSSSALPVLAWALVGLLSIARFVELDARPLHHDEGVNAWKLAHVMNTGVFEYDPHNYHGPSLFFLQLLPTGLAWLLDADGAPVVSPGWRGITEVSLRSGVALLGCLVLAGLFAARRRIGALGGVVAAALAGLSCSFLYYSRDFIHEIPFVAFTLGLYLAAERFAGTGRRRYLVLAAAAASLVFCTKETSVLTFAAMAGAALAASLAVRREGGESGAARGALRELRAAFESARPHLKVAIPCGVGIWLALYSWFFSRPRGIVDSLATYLPWVRAAMSSGHDKDWDYYLVDILWPYEPALSALALPALVAALWKREWTGLFLASWAALTLAGYSAIPYKTPWLILNALLPMSLLAGWGVDRGVAWSRSLQPRWRTGMLGAGSLVVVGLLSCQAAPTADVVYEEYDDSRHALVYSQTVRDLRRLLVILETKASPLEKPVVVDVVAKEYWPLPFYLRGYDARFWDVPVPDAPFVIANPSQRQKLLEALGDGWPRSTYDLRPGVKLDLWSRPPAGP